MSIESLQNTSAWQWASIIIFLALALGGIVFALVAILRFLFAANKGRDGSSDPRAATRAFFEGPDSLRDLTLPFDTGGDRLESPRERVAVWEVVTLVVLVLSFMMLALWAST